MHLRERCYERAGWITWDSCKLVHCFQKAPSSTACPNRRHFASCFLGNCYSLSCFFHPSCSLNKMSTQYTRRSRERRQNRASRAVEAPGLAENSVPLTQAPFVRRDYPGAAQWKVLTQKLLARIETALFRKPLSFEIAS